MKLLQTQEDTEQARPAILIVDDSSVDRETVAILCSQLECVIDTARSGVEALEKFEEGDYALVISDYQMEPINGLELIDRMRSVRPDQECILLTGFPDPEAAAYVRRNEMSPMLAKPVAPKSLISSALTSLRRIRHAREGLDLIALSNRMDKCPALCGFGDAVGRLRRDVRAMIESEGALVVDGPKSGRKMEVVRFLHEMGPLSASLCLDYDCAGQSEEALNRDLISPEGELGEVLKLARDGSLILENFEQLPHAFQRGLARSFPSISRRVRLIVLVEGSFEAALEEGMIDVNLYFQLAGQVLHIPGEIGIESGDEGEASPLSGIR
ncbi:MAG: response regulator [Verrucomicrobiota bacterium]